MGMTESLRGLLENFNHPTQEYANTLPYMLGGLTIVCLVLLMLSGMYLAPFYVPTPQEAYSSTLNIIRNVPFGEFARSVHLWAANIIVLMIALHLARIVITGSYKKPRRALYIVGVLMFFVILFMTYLGTVLPLDQIGADAAIRSQQTAALFGIDVPFSQMIGPTAVAHISIMVVILLVLLGIHVYLIEKTGISTKAKKGAVARKTAGEGRSDFLTHLAILTGFGCILAALVGALAFLYPAPIGHPGVYDPSVMITKPVEAIFYANDTMLDAFGPLSLIFGPLLLFVLLLVFPFADTSKYVHWRRRKPAIVLGIIVLAIGLYFIYMDMLAVAPYSGICTSPPSNGMCVQPDGQALENVSEIINESMGLNPAMYFISNGTPATAADVYGGFVDVPSPLRQEGPAIAVALAALGALGVAILKRDKIASLLKL